MSIQKLSDYLKKFSRIRRPHEEIKDKVVSLVYKKFGITLPKEAIVVRKKKVFITTSPIIKNEIFMDKKNILEEISLEDFIVEDII